MANIKMPPKKQLLPLVNLSAVTAELQRLDCDPDAPLQSETVELVDAVIDYYEALAFNNDCKTKGLDELIDARCDYNGPGISPMQRIIDQGKPPRGRS